MVNTTLTGGHVPLVPVSSTPNPAPAAPQASSTPESALAIKASPGEMLADAPLTLQPVTDPLINTKLSAQQAKALIAITSGKTLSSAAEAAGVSRSTLYRWQSGDPQFIAALHAWQNQCLESARHRVLALADKAVVAVHASLLNCDGRMGLAILKELGAFTQPSAAPSADPDIVAAEMARRSRWKKVEQVRDERAVKIEEHITGIQ